jgi:hypothetical protein
MKTAVPDRKKRIKILDGGLRCSFKKGPLTSFEFTGKLLGSPQYAIKTDTHRNEMLQEMRTQSRIKQNFIKKIANVVNTSYRHVIKART